MKILFTDGATSAGRTCGAAVLLDFNSENNTIEILNHSVKINESSTNNEAEFFGILKGLEMLEDNEECYLYSDSEYCINSLTKWIKTWYKTFSCKKDATIITPKMISKSGKEVKNCKLIVYIINTIVNKKLKIHFLHILGHKKCNNKKDLTSQASYFSKINNIDINIAKEQSKFICKFNNYIDNFAKLILDNYMNGEYDNEISCMSTEKCDVIKEYFTLKDEITKTIIHIDINYSNDFQDKLYSIYLLNDKIMKSYFSLIV